MVVEHVPEIDSRANANVPRPFTLRVAVKRYPIDEAPESEGNQHLVFSRRAGLTGSLAQTRSGEDVEVSDVEIE